MSRHRIAEHHARGAHGQRPACGMLEKRGYNIRLERYLIQAFRSSWPRWRRRAPAHAGLVVGGAHGSGHVRQMARARLARVTSAHPGPQDPDLRDLPRRGRDHPRGRDRLAADAATRSVNWSVLAIYFDTGLLASPCGRAACPRSSRAGPARGLRKRSTRCSSSAPWPRSCRASWPSPVVVLMLAAWPSNGDRLESSHFLYLVRARHLVKCRDTGEHGRGPAGPILAMSTGMQFLDFYWSDKLGLERSRSWVLPQPWHAHVPVPEADEAVNIARAETKVTWDLRCLRASVVALAVPPWPLPRGGRSGRGLLSLLFVRTKVARQSRKSTELLPVPGRHLRAHRLVDRWACSRTSQTGHDVGLTQPRLLLT